MRRVSGRLCEAFALCFPLPVPRTEAERRTEASEVGRCGRGGVEVATVRLFTTMLVAQSASLLLFAPLGLFDGDFASLIAATVSEPALHREDCASCKEVARTSGGRFPLCLESHRAGAK